MFLNREIEKFESIKDKVKHYETIISDLTLKSEGNSNPRLKKAIDYYNKKIVKLERELDRIRNG